MQSKNPIFRDMEKQPGFAYNEGVNAYQAAGAGTATLEQPGGPTVGIPTAGRPMTIDDVVTKTAMAFVVLVIGAGISAKRRPISLRRRRWGFPSRPPPVPWR